MASTTYDHFAGYGETVTKRHHFVGVNKMYAAQEQFRRVTKMVCSRNKCREHHHFAVLNNMVRNAGELPQPFWLGAACGGGSHSLSASVARA
jgi:hypothetical protein